MSVTEKQDKKISKFLSLILRHKPHAVGISLDNEGWADVETLLRALNNHHHHIDMARLEHIVATNDKQRFAFDTHKQKIRANQGHSIDVCLNLPEVAPPETLYHGTARGAIDGIMAQGIDKQQRQYVHLSADTQTAIKVGRRHGKVVVFVVQAGKMHQAGMKFYQADNGVWLTEHVPVAYLSVFEGTLV
ncbi:MAG: RNA 2'-phosphotransferase [Moraxella sp.]|nr:RNA 2'-phosphotransferase [Moraxella sp.]